MNVQLITYEIDDSSSAVYTQPVGLSGLVKTSNDFGATFVPLRSYHSLNCQSYQQSVSVQDNFVYKFSFCTDWLLNDPEGAIMNLLKYQNQICWKQMSINPISDHIRAKQ